MKKTTTFAILCLLAAASGAWAQSDKIKFKGEKETTCIIGTITHNKVTFNEDGVDKERPAKDVEKIQFDSQQNYDFEMGRQALENKSFEAARERFEKALKLPGAPDSPVKQAARKCIIQCDLGANKNDAAIAAAKAFRNDLPTSFYLKESFLLQYDAARALSNPALMEEALKDFEKTAQGLGMDDWKKKTQLMRADLAFNNSKFGDAKGIYGGFVNDKDQDVALEGRLGLLRSTTELCTKGQSPWGVLKMAAEGFINKPDGVPPEQGVSKLLLAAYLARGRALLGDKNYKDAFNDLARCIVDLVDKAGEFGSYREEAIGWGGIACARYAAEQKAQETRNTYRDRAYQLKDELTQRFKGSGFIQKINDAIQAIPK